MLVKYCLPSTLLCMYAHNRLHSAKLRTQRVTPRPPLIVGTWYPLWFAATDTLVLPREEISSYEQQCSHAQCSRAVAWDTHLTPGVVGLSWGVKPAGVPTSWPRRARPWEVLGCSQRVLGSAIAVALPSRGGAAEAHAVCATRTCIYPGMQY